MNVYDQAHGLASAIKESEEFKQYNALKKQIDANEELSKMLKDFQAKQLEFQTKQMMGEQPNTEDMAGIQQLYTIMAADPLTSQYLQAEMRTFTASSAKPSVSATFLAKSEKIHGNFLKKIE